MSVAYKKLVPKAGQQLSYFQRTLEIRSDNEIIKVIGRERERERERERGGG